MKLYGSIANRLEENHYYNGTKDNIVAGTLCTVYLYTDTQAYEVIKVNSQKRILKLDD